MSIISDFKPGEKIVIERRGGKNAVGIIRKFFAPNETFQGYAMIDQVHVDIIEEGYGMKLGRFHFEKTRECLPYTAPAHG